jgi:hypothetical protein
MNVGSTSVNQLTCFAGRSLKWMLGHTAHIGKYGWQVWAIGLWHNQNRIQQLAPHHQNQMAECSIRAKL